MSATNHQSQKESRRGEVCEGDDPLYLFDIQL